MVFQQNRISGSELPASGSCLKPVERAAAKKILVVDDDPVVLKAIAAKLESKSYKVVTATDASHALNLARRESPDLVLLDVNFPPDVGGVDWNGFRIIQWLRMHEDVRNVPVIVMSGDDRAEYQRRAVEMGAAGFLPKTIHSEGLLACVEMAITHKKPAGPISKSSSALGFSPQPAFRLDSPTPGASESAHLTLGSV